MPAGKPPFFIVGSARSGTTLLRLMLNAHRAVAVPPESRFITEIQHNDAPIGAERFLSALGSHKRFQAWDLPLEAVRSEIEADPVPYADAIAAAYRVYARLNGMSSTYRGDKTPRYVEDIPFIAGLFPEARFIHLIRDGRNVALSYANVPFGPKNVSKAASLWASRVQKGCQDGRALGRGRYIEIRYEDLVEDAPGEARDICEFLELEFDDGMLEYTERARDAVLDRAARFNPNVTKKPTQTRSWTTEMPDGQVAIFEAIAGDCLSELGYKRRFPRPPMGARIAATLGKIGLPTGRLHKQQP